MERRKLHFGDEVLIVLGVFCLVAGIVFLIGPDIKTNGGSLTVILNFVKPLPGEPQDVWGVVYLLICFFPFWAVIRATRSSQSIAYRVLLFIGTLWSVGLAYPLFAPGYSLNFMFPLIWFSCTILGYLSWFRFMRGDRVHRERVNPEREDENAASGNDRS